MSVPDSNANAEPGDVSDLTLTRSVHPAGSVRNLFAGVPLNAVNVGLSDNGWSNGHQDAYSSDSVNVDGPTGSRLTMRRVVNDRGAMMIMVCNTKGALIGASVRWDNDSQVYLTVFDSKSMKKIAEQPIGNVPGTSFRGGYFFLDHEENAVAINTDSTFSRYETSGFAAGETRVGGDDPSPINEMWRSPVIGGTDPNANLYGVMAVGDEASNPNRSRYWTVVTPDGPQSPTATVTTTVKVIDIAPDGTIVSSSQIDTPGYWTNNTLTADDTGLYVIYNSPEGAEGVVHKYTTTPDGDVKLAWSIPYAQVPYVKMGMTNTGSGSTVSLMDHAPSGNKLVVFCDNAEPRTHVCVYRETGDSTPPELVGKVPVFRPMRSATEASPVAFNNTVIVSSNFGHTVDGANGTSQYVPNEPGITCVRVNDACTSVDTAWEAALPINSSFGMPQLSRSSGILYVFSGQWSPDTAVEGSSVPTAEPQYYISAYDAFDGRIIWQVPVGAGYPNTHEYGGIYFDRLDENGRSSKSLYVGTNRHLVKVTSDEN
ncbi:hypothetical protein ACIQWZ_39230 [Streptomyces sp. NPDC098077]|uniref:hypothetical protein n=1 Tax=Streptomyces sp. NPDC098077 TaxID=3366093 RepID=UPI0038164B9C